MYEAHWNLTFKPFSYRTPAVECWAVAAQSAALLRLNYCVEIHAGCALLLGDSGVGKTTLLRIFETQHNNLCPFVRLAFPGLSSSEQLRMIAGQLAAGPPSASTTDDELLLSIQNGLLHHCSESEQHPVICFDDAQLLSSNVLNDVVLALLNLRDLDDRLNFTVILAGQPILASKIARQAQLRERVAVTARLTGLTIEETRSCITSSVKNAARDDDSAAHEIFTPAAIDRLHEVTQGNPRRLNRLGDMALLVACSENASQISADQIDAISTELLPAA